MEGSHGRRRGRGLGLEMTRFLHLSLLYNVELCGSG